MDRIISGFPAYVMRDGLYPMFSVETYRIKIEISGLDGLNGTINDYLVMGPFGVGGCTLYKRPYSFDVTYTISYNDTVPSPQTCATPLTVTETLTVTFGTNGGVLLFDWDFNGDILNSVGELSFFASRVYGTHIKVPLMSYGGTVNLCNGNPGFEETETWLNDIINVCSPSVGPVSGTIRTEFDPQYGPPNTIKALGIRYTISDLPTEFISRIGSSTTVIGVSGLEAFNGTYDIDFADAEDCTGGTYEEEIEVTVQEYDVSTSSPCTSATVGYPVAGTARLVLAPTNEQFFTWVIRIEHPYLTGVRIDYIELSTEWPTGIHCTGHEATWDHGDECASNSSPVITVEAEPYFV